MPIEKWRVKLRIISIHAGKAFDKIQHPLTIKKKYIQQSRYRCNVPQHNKGFMWEAQSKHQNQQWKIESVSLQSGIRQGCPFLLFLFSTVYVVLGRAVRPEKEIKDI